MFCRLKSDLKVGKLVLKSFFVLFCLKYIFKHNWQVNVSCTLVVWLLLGSLALILVASLPLNHGENLQQFVLVVGSRWQKVKTVNRLQYRKHVSVLTTSVLCHFTVGGAYICP